MIFPAAVAQERGGDRGRERSLPIVTATSSAQRVRIHSSGETTQMRLEVFDAAGQHLFDSGFRDGNLLEWPMVDQRGERPADGSYLCVTTARDLGGRESRRSAVLTVASGQGKLEPLNVERLTAGQTQALSAEWQALATGSTRSDESLSVLDDSARTAMTVAAHDGRDGKVVSTRGALNLGTGDILSGTNVDHVRITEEGRVGIGTDKPEATLDVAGEVRARGGIRFADGTTMISSSNAPGSRLDADGAPLPGPSAAGTGTQNRLAKWAETGGAGTLTDSNLTEVGGNVGIGTAAPVQALHVIGKSLFQNTGTASLFIVDRTDGKIAALGAAGTSSTLAYDQTGTFKIESNLRANIAAGIFGTGATTRFAIDTFGQVGIGTSTPTRMFQIGPSSDAAFTFSPSDGSPNAGFIRFGDRTGWKLHFARNRESSNGPLNGGTAGLLMTLQDNGNVAIGSASPQAKLDVRGDIKLGNSGELFAPGGEENLRIVRGVVGFNGNIIVGSGFTASHAGGGKYTITFNTPFAGAPAMTVTPDFNGNYTHIAMTSSVSASQANIRTFFRSDGDNGPATFHFIAIGPR